MAFDGSFDLSVKGHTPSCLKVSGDSDQTDPLVGHL